MVSTNNAADVDAVAEAVGDAYTAVGCGRGVGGGDACVVGLRHGDVGCMAKYLKGCKVEQNWQKFVLRPSSTEK